MQSFHPIHKCSMVQLERMRVWIQNCCAEEFGQQRHSCHYAPPLRGLQSLRWVSYGFSFSSLFCYALAFVLFKFHFLNLNSQLAFFSFLTICIYPSVYGVLCSTNGIRVNPSELGLKTWATVLDSLQMQNVLPTSKLLLSKPDFPAPSAPGSVIPSKWLFLFSLFLRW